MRLNPQGAVEAMGAPFTNNAGFVHLALFDQSASRTPFCYRGCGPSVTLEAPLYARLAYLYGNIMGTSGNMICILPSGGKLRSYLKVSFVRP